jgi:hypothetical protein
MKMAMGKRKSKEKQKSETTTKKKIRTSGLLKVPFDGATELSSPCPEE